MRSLPNIVHVRNVSKFVEYQDDPDDFISMNKDLDDFTDIASLNSFIKECEKKIRTNDEYSLFISYVKNVIGLNYCQIQPDITDMDATIEMHHGPLFTLYDYVDILLNKRITNGDKINTFVVVDDVIKEHFEGRVQIVMLTSTNHESVTNRDTFLNIRQGFGNINEFLKMYSKYLSDEQKYKIYRYIEFSKHNASYDNGVLDTVEIEKMIVI